MTTLATSTIEHALNGAILADVVSGTFVAAPSTGRWAIDYFPSDSYSIQGWRKVVLIDTGEAYAVTTGGRELGLTETEALDMIHGKYFPRTCTAR
jgi:hypothetical protein